MYLHLGQDYVVHTDDIIGIFDIDTTTISKHTRGFLRHAEQESALVTLRDELPKSFVVTDFPGETVYISPISSKTLEKRCGRLDQLGINER